MATITEFKSPSLIERITKESPVLSRLLDDLWRDVEPSLSNVNAIFPEYTPHDFTHLQRLFNLCENILTKEMLARLNVTECFLLSASIVAHDWGMGVNPQEQRAIITGKEGRIKLSGPDDEESSVALLPDEHRRLHQHQLSRGLEFKWSDENGTLAQSEQLDSWRDYLRNTHPERSAERIRLYLYREKTIGQAIALISHGHGQEHSVIENIQQYSIRRLINGEIVNVQALTLYLRLIDLIDVGKGRTPYELWQYVNPGNQISAKEWKKHRAMEEPTLDGSTLKFAALTRSGSILAELYNLKHYCESEFEWQKRILRQSGLQSYEYVFQNMEWDIATEGNLHNSPVRFEFARDQLLHLLSEEIYEGDPYVFLRELVQNAVDATKTRQACCMNAGTPLDARLAVVNIYATEENSNITVRDSGSGMTAYVIEKYLAVAGQSYYRSQDFARLGLTIDPISRFGIGILSCFVVADRVIIRTRTDPECFADGHSKPTEAWRLEIPAGRGGLPLGYWEWTTIDPNSTSVGTEVTVIIDPKKLRTQLAKLSAESRTNYLQISSYLETVATFTEFPIYVDEFVGKTVILHPTSNPEALLDNSNFRVSRLDYPYQLSEHVNPLDLSAAEDHITIKTIDLRTLNIPGVEGVLSYPKPKYPWRVIGRQAREIILCDRNNNEITIKGPRYTSGDQGFMESFRAVGISKSSKKFKRSGVYFQGLLMSDTPAPKEVGIHGPSTSTLLAFPNLYLNYTKQIDPELRPGPSRRNLKNSSDHWANQIFTAHSKLTATQAREHLLSLDPSERLSEIFRHLEQDFISAEDFATGFEWGEWPIPTLLSGGQIEVCLLKDLQNNTILIKAPHVVGRIASMHLLNTLGYKYRNAPSLHNWAFDQCVFTVHFDNIPHPTGSYVNKVLQNSYHPSYQGKMAFSPPSLKEAGLLPPMYTSYWKKRLANTTPFHQLTYNDIIEVCKKGMSEPKNLGERDLLQLQGIVPSRLHFRNVAEHLPESFAKYCLWSDNEINVQHNVGRTLCRIFSAYCKSHLEKSLSLTERARLDQVLNGLPIQTFSQGAILHGGRVNVPVNSLSRVNEHLHLLKSTVESIEALNLGCLPNIKLTPNDLLPGAFNFEGSDSFFVFSFEGDSFLPELFYDALDDKSFGSLLKKSSPWA